MLVDDGDKQVGEENKETVGELLFENDDEDVRTFVVVVDDFVSLTATDL